jgi:uncharacterized damage-inducible protein DinB
VLTTSISEIAAFPDSIIEATRNLTKKDLNLTYREGSWNIRQLVHHCADSHMNAFIRLKLALTEDVPVIKPYNENEWSRLKDSVEYPIDYSLDLLKSLHYRWTFLLNTLDEEQFQRRFIHPEKSREMTLWESTALYAWHGKHHVAHIKLALNGLT